MSTKGLQLASFILPGKSLYPPLVILHGLFGSKQNWQSISKRLSQKIEYPLHVLDLRNHGESPHHEEMTYELMAKDVDTYLHSHSLQNPILIGHSMGGKVALATAKLHPSSIRGVISIDMSPLEGPISPLFQRYIQAMLELEKAKPKRLLDANVFLEKSIDDVAVRNFLLTNLKSVPGSNVLQFRIPLQILSKNIPNLARFLPSSELQYDGPTLLIGAKKENYLRETMLNDIRKSFPKAEIEMMDTGHWIHAEQPLQLIEKIKKFVKHFT